MDIVNASGPRLRAWPYVLLLVGSLMGPVPAGAGEHAVDRLDINTASAAELAEGLPGIGPVKATRIVEHRTRTGGFESVDALVEVKGIGPRTLERLRQLVTVGAVRESAARQREEGTRKAVRRIIAQARQPRPANASP